MNQRGNVVLDMITIIVVVIVMAISLLYGNYILGTINDDIASDDSFGIDAKGVTATMDANYSSLFDNIFLFAFSLFVVFVLVSVFLIDTHPVFFVISVILLIFVFIVGGLLANSYNDIASDDTISSYANNFTFINWVMGHLIELIIGIGFMVSIVLFAKFRR